MNTKKRSLVLNIVVVPKNQKEEHFGKKEAKQCRGKSAGVEGKRTAKVSGDGKWRKIHPWVFKSI